MELYIPGLKFIQLFIIFGFSSSAKEEKPELFRLKEYFKLFSFSLQKK